MKILTVRQILILHETLLKKHGGSSGVRDLGMLESAVHRPFATFAGEDLYPDMFLKIGALIQSLVKNHPFVDGNKRTAYVSAFTVLKYNQVKITATQKEVIKLMISVANENLSVDEISSWLRSHSSRMSS